MKRLWVTGYRSYELGVFSDKDPKLTVIKYALSNYLKSLLEEGKIYVDLRIGQYHDGKNKGKTHDHGTGFRIKESDQPLLFKVKRRIG